MSNFICGCTESDAVSDIYLCNLYAMKKEILTNSIVYSF